MQKQNPTRRCGRANHGFAQERGQESEPKRQIGRSMARSNCFGASEFCGKLAVSDRAVFGLDYRSSRNPSISKRFRR